MKKIIVFVLILCSIKGIAQTPPGYTNISARYDWLAGRFRNGLHVPQYNGIPTDRTGVWIGDGAVAIDSANGYFYYRNGGVWIKVAKFSDIAANVPTFQQTLTAGSILDTDNEIDVDGFEFRIKNGITIGLNAVGVGYTSDIEVLPGHVDIAGSGSTPNHNSQVFIDSDSISLRPHQGRLNIDSLRTWTTIGDTTYKKPMTWDTRNGRWEYAANWYGSGGSSGLAIGAAITSGTATRVLFEGAGNVLAQDADMTFDGTRLTSSFRAHNGSATTPSYSFTNTTGTGLYYDGTYYAEAMGGVPIRNTFVASGASGFVQMDFASPSGAALGDGKSYTSFVGGDSYATSGIFQAGAASLIANSGLANGINIGASSETGRIDFYAGGAVSGNHVMTIDPALRVGIGLTAPLATLHLVGGFRYVDGNQGAGKILVSDGDGDGTWTTGLPISSLTTSTANNTVPMAGFNFGLSTSGAVTFDGDGSDPFTVGDYSDIILTAGGAPGNYIRLNNSNNIVISADNGSISLSAAANITVGSPMSLSNSLTMTGGRIIIRQGADVASVNGAIALGADGNMFELTGTNAVTLISNSGWQNGSEIVLLFTSTAQLTDGTANSGTDIGMELAANTNFVGSAGSVLTLVLTEIGGTQRWREKNRSVN